MASQARKWPCANLRFYVRSCRRRKGFEKHTVSGASCTPRASKGRGASGQNSGCYKLRWKPQRECFLHYKCKVLFSSPPTVTEQRGHPTKTFPIEIDCWSVDAANCVHSALSSAYTGRAGSNKRSM